MMENKMRPLGLTRPLLLGSCMILVLLMCSNFVTASSSSSDSASPARKIVDSSNSNINNHRNYRAVNGHGSRRRIESSASSTKMCDSLHCMTTTSSSTTTTTTNKPAIIIAASSSSSSLKTERRHKSKKKSEYSDNSTKNKFQTTNSTTTPTTNGGGVGGEDDNKKIVDVDQLLHKASDSRRECKLKQSTSFYCQRVRWSWWVIKQLDRNMTKLNDYVELVRRNDETDGTPLASTGSDADDDAADAVLDTLSPWPVKQIEKFLVKYASPMEQFLFYKLKKYWKSKELWVTVPQFQTQIKIGPNTHKAVETGRIFFDPGFNLKMKVPFFRDEMKFAVSTGPSFLAGLGVGMVVLGIKSLFSPVMMAVKAMMLSYFMKDMSPFDFFKVLGFGGGGDEVVEEVQNVEVYDPPVVNNPYDNVLDKHAHHHHGHHHGHHGPPPHGGYATGSHPSHGLTSFNLNTLSSNNYNLGGYSGGGGGAVQSHYSQPSSGRINPILQQYAQNIQTDLTAPASQQSYSPQSFVNYQGGGGGAGRDHRRPFATSSFTSGNNLDTQESIVSTLKNSNSQQQSTFKYVPSAALQLEVENYDPFYSPLLSRIDSVFMHLGFTEEGCKERAVCSIYKFPVKYAPYSNLLSAQLSKHQSELKRPVSTSPKILRYFKYMKAAKDGQGALNCTELYPKCTKETDKLSNLPMVKTFQQLTELMGTGTG